MSRNNIIDDEDLKLLNALVDPSSVASNSITVLNEEFDVLTPENARFVAGQDLYLYVPKVQTNKRYGLAKFNATDFSVSNNGVVSLLYSKSQIEDYFTEVRGGSREQTVIADPAINLLNLDKTDKSLKSEIDDLYSKDSEIYGSSHREGTVLNGINLTTLNERDNTLQRNIDFIIQDDRVNTSVDSTYSAKKITQLIKDAKMEGLHFVGFIGAELGKDYNGESEAKEGSLWLISDTTDKPNKDMFKDAEVYILNGETWELYTEYEQSNFDIWKNVNIADENINTWWYFEGVYEVLDFGVDMNLYYTKIESDARFKSIFTYGSYLSEVNKVLTIDNLVMPTTGKLSSFIKGESKLESTNVEDAIKELEVYSQGEIDKINDRPFWLNFIDEPTREGEYSVTTNGVYRSYKTDDGFEWRLVTTDLDSLLPRVNAHRDVANGLDFYVDSETGYLLSTLKLINLNTENESSTPVSVPVATLSNDGIMPATAMRGISELELRVNALESGTKSYFVDFGSDTPTQAVLDIIYQTAAGTTEAPPDLTRLIDVDRNMYFEYYSELEVHWQGAYTYRYGIAELDVPGLVTASEQKGQIFVEPVTGKMSLNGYTDIINTFNTLYGGESRSSIAVSQVPELPATKITSGTLNSARLPIVPISKGGTNNESFSAYKLVITGDVDETDSTANKLMDGPSFGALDTILVGQGNNQIPVFKSLSNMNIELTTRKINDLSGSSSSSEYPTAFAVNKELSKKANIIDIYDTNEVSVKPSTVKEHNSYPTVWNMAASDTLVRGVGQQDFTIWIPNDEVGLQLDTTIPYPAEDGLRYDARGIGRGPDRFLALVGATPSEGYGRYLYLWECLDSDGVWVNKGQIGTYLNSPPPNLIYANGRYVTGMGDDNTVYYSDDLITWNSISVTLSNSTGDLSRIAYGDGKFVMLSSNQTYGSRLAVSNNGAGWTRYSKSQVTALADIAWADVTYGNGVFVAVPSTKSKICVTSTDGLSWTRHETLPEEISWARVCYGDGVFVATADGYSNIAAYSVDGVNWYKVTLSSTAYYGNIVYCNGYFFLPGWNNDGVDLIIHRIPSMLELEKITDDLKLSIQSVSNELKDEVSNREEELKKYLKLTGGHMTGPIHFDINFIDQYTKPESTQWFVSEWFRDTNNKAIAVKHIAHLPSGDIEHQIDVRRDIGNTGSETNYASIRVGMTDAGVGYAKCPKPADSSNSDDIATTAWVRDQINKLLNGTTTFTYLKANVVDLV